MPLHLPCLAVATMAGMHRRGPVSASETAGELFALHRFPEAEPYEIQLEMLYNLVSYVDYS